MKRICTITKLVTCIAFAGLFATACTKSNARPQEPGVIKDQPVYNTDSTTIGSVSVSEAPGGEAKVSIQLNTGLLASFRPPFQPILLENSEPLAYLNLIDPATGISETSPVISTNRNLTVSYHLLLYTRDLKLRIVDGDQRVIAVVKLR